MRADGIAEAEMRAVLSKQNYTEADIAQAMATTASNTVKTQNVVLTKAQTVAHYALAAAAKVANVVLTAGLGIIISLVATKFITWLTDVIGKQEDLSEAASKAKDNLDEIFDTINTKKSTVKELAQEYAELAQGVNQLTGENVSLSTEDYERFLDLSNQLSDQFPELTRKFDDNGNAILDLTGNVDGIVSSLNDLIKVQQDLANQEIVSNMSTIYEDYYEETKKLRDKIEKENEKQQELDEAKETLLNSPRSFNYTQNAERRKVEKAAETFGLDYNTRQVEALDGTPMGFVVDIDGLLTTENVLSKYDELYKQSLLDISTYKNQLAVEEKEINKYIVACLQPDLDVFNFGKNDSTIKAAIEKMFAEFDPSNLPEYIDSSDWSKVYTYLKQIYLYPISELKDDVKQKLADVFNKPEGISNQEYVKIANELQQYFNDNHININLDFVVDDERDLESRFKNNINKITKGDRREKNRLNKFVKKESIDSSEEKEYFLSVTKNAESATEAIELYNEAKGKIDKWEEIDLEPVHENLDSIRDAYQKVSDAIDEYEEYSYLSLETVQELINLDDKYLSCLYNEEGQLILNTEAYNNLTRAKLEEMKVGIINNALDTVESLSSEEEAAKYLKDAHIDLTNVNWELFESNIALAQSELALLSDTEAIEQRQAALDQIAESTKARINLINEALNSVGSGQNRQHFYTGSNSKDNDKKDKDTGTDKEPVEIDWADQSLKVLENEVDKCKDILDDTYGYENQIKAIDDLNSALGRLKSGYESVREEYSERYTNNLAKLSNGDVIRGYIESGKKFDLSEYDSDTAEIIKNAIDAYNNMIEAENKINELTGEIDYNENIEKSVAQQKEYELSLEGVQTLLENEMLTASDRNDLLKEQYKYQAAINEELAKQAEHEGNILEAENLRKKNKQLERDYYSEKWQTKINENDNYINAKNSLLESRDLTEDQIDDINDELQFLTEDSYKYQFKDLIKQLDVDGIWSAYIKDLKKQYGQEDVSNKKFIKEHLEEIAEHFSYIGMETLYYDFVNSIDEFSDMEYENHKNTSLYYINNNNNKLANIQSAIDYAGGRGTEQQYTDMKLIHQDSIKQWTDRKEEAETFLNAQEEGTAGWDKWNAEVQECQENIDACNQSIKDCNISILSLPLNDIEDKLKEIQNTLDDINDQTDDYNTYIGAANFILDTQINNQTKLKESIQDEIDNLQKANDIRQANLQLQQAEYNLEKLKNQKTERVFVEGEGWVYQSDQDAIRDAQVDYDEAVFNKRISDLNAQINIHDEEIKRLNKIKEQWSEIVTIAQGLVDINKALAYDSDFVSKVLSGDINLLDSISFNMNDLYQQKSDAEDEQKKYQDLEKAINDIVDSYNLSNSYEEAHQQILNILQTDYPELFNKYNTESEKLQEIIDKKLNNAKTTKESSENINKAVNESNKKILNSYTTLQEDLTEVFTNLNTLLDTYVTNTKTMASTISTAITEIQNKINSLPSLNANISITSTTTTEDDKKSSGKKDTKKDVKTAGKSHSGLELGYLGEKSESADKKAFKYIALDEIDDNEMLRLVQKGEAVLTPNQIGTVMSNFRNLAEVKLPTFIPNTSSNSVSFNGDIVINNPIGDTQKLAREIKQNFGNTILQELYKK